MNNTESKPLTLTLVRDFCLSFDLRARKSPCGFGEDTLITYQDIFWSASALKEGQATKFTSQTGVQLKVRFISGTYFFTFKRVRTSAKK